LKINSRERLLQKKLKKVFLLNLQSHFKQLKAYSDKQEILIKKESQIREKRNSKQKLALWQRWFSLLSKRTKVGDFFYF